MKALHLSKARHLLLYGTLSVFVSINSFCQESSGFDWTDYRYVIQVPTEYSITDDRGGLDVKIPDLFAVERSLNEAFREPSDEGRACELLTFDDVGTANWGNAKTTSCLFLLVRPDITKSTLFWSFYDSRKGFDSPVVEYSEPFKPCAIPFCYDPIQKANEDLIYQVKREVWYSEYNKSSAREKFGQFTESGFEQMFASAGYQEVRTTSGPYAKFNISDLNETQARELVMTNNDSPLIGIYRSINQVSELSLCPSMRFAILPTDDYRYKACFLKELGSSEDSFFWHPGDVRMVLEPTSNPGIYAGTSLHENDRKKEIYDVYAELNQGSLVVRYDDANFGSNGCSYLKLFPSKEVQVSKPQVTTTDPDIHSSGSCVLVNRSQGIVATNHHVVEDMSRFEVHLGGKTFEATVIIDDAENDLALLRLSDPSSLPEALPLDIAPKLGLEITAAGFPKIFDMGTDIKLTRGIISALTFLGMPGMIQIDCAITNGNSGGAVLDNEGHLIGISTSGWRPDVHTENANGAVKSLILFNLMQTAGINPVLANDSNGAGLDEALKSVGYIYTYQ